MENAELWGSGWSLRPDQDQRTMTYLGSVVRSGTRFNYYKDENNDIYFDDEPEDGKQEHLIRFVVLRSPIFDIIDHRPAYSIRYWQS